MTPFLKSMRSGANSCKRLSWPRTNRHRFDIGTVLEFARSPDLEWERCPISSLTTTPQGVTYRRLGDPLFTAGERECELRRARPSDSSARRKRLGESTPSDHSYDGYRTSPGPSRRCWTVTRSALANGRYRFRRRGGWLGGRGTGAYVRRSSLRLSWQSSDSGCRALKIRSADGRVRRPRRGRRGGRRVSSAAESSRDRGDRDVPGL
jgi:hypothetical protein